MTVWRRRRDQQEAQAVADAALKDSVDELHAAALRSREVRRVAGRLRELREENHFAERFREIYNGRPA